MDSRVKIFIERGKTELKIAETLFRLSNNADEKTSLDIKEDMTFYSAVISHSYYCIFYAAKAILMSKNIKTSTPEVHKKTYEEFKRVFVDSGILDVELLRIYRKLVIRADELLGIFKEEKWKRGHYTYKTIPQANKGPAEESIENAKTFLSNIIMLIEA
ncbi:MAG: hypothetical protein DRO96_01190 [Candidatus Aenigmatarchaeota archaeon]|nr:MAG: hypothetical protein DRO96_01190 [Candidatus Aenigmarchaeota archaeon]